MNAPKETLSVNVPRMCPICSVESIELVVLDARLSVSFTGQALSVPDLAAYRCGVGHLFFLPVGQRAREDSAEGQACSIFL